METQLATTTQEPSIYGMMQAVIDGGVTGENVGVLERLIDLRLRTRAIDAEQEFARAFVALQAEIPKIRAVKSVMNKDGQSERFRFAPYEEIMNQVQPLLTAHGFTVSFDTLTEPPRVTSICTLTHSAGHSRVNRFSVQIGNGPPGCSPTQADGAAGSYAKRYALCDALNIRTAMDWDGDDDAKLLGEPIDDFAAEDLKKRVIEVGANAESFLAFAGVKSFHHIPASRLEELHQILDRKAAKKA